MDGGEEGRRPFAWVTDTDRAGAAMTCELSFS
jgi:hypothetical protein